MSFLSSASVDIVLLVVTIVHLTLAARVLSAANKRDRGYAELFDRWIVDLQQSARERAAKSRPSAAE